MRLWLYLFRGLPRQVSNRAYFHADSVLSVDFMFDMQVATHLKGLAEKGKLNEKHVRIARIYKARAVGASAAYD